MTDDDCKPEPTTLPANEGTCGCPLEVRYRKALARIAEGTVNASMATAIAIGALGEVPDFDPEVDALRSEVARLRAILADIARITAPKPEVHPFAPDGNLE